MGYPEIHNFGDKIEFTQDYKSVLSEAKKGDKGIIVHIDERDQGEPGKELSFYGIRLFTAWKYITSVPWYAIKKASH